MTRWAVQLEYDGTGFVGWQRQANGLSIQLVFEEAAGHLAGGPVSSIVAGRTDAGVHALGQVAHFCLAREISAERLVQALNFYMRPHRVSVLRATVVPDDWSARFSAVARAYRYFILNRPARPALAAGRVWHVPQALDVAAMADGARRLLGRHDFSSFRAASCQADSPVRTLDRLEVFRDGDCVVVEAGARSFLHHQVRNMVGTLKLVGEGRWPAERMATTLAAADRRAAGPTAPAEGLFLTAVTYPDATFS